MKISNLKIYDLAESILAARLPMLSEYNDNSEEREECRKELNDMLTDYDFSKCEFKSKALKLCNKLCTNDSNSGHCNFLSGILVSMDISATIKWWEQFQRYHFKQIVSSMSTMHCITKFNPDTMFAETVLPETVELFKTLIDKYNKEIITFDQLVDNTPLGTVLTARITTNYLQLRTMYQQRHNHKYHEWKCFIEMIDELPFCNLIYGFNAVPSIQEEKK